MCRQCGDDVAILQSLMSSPYESDVKGRKRGEREERESNVSWKERGNGEWNEEEGSKGLQIINLIRM